MLRAMLVICSLLGGGFAHRLFAQPVELDTVISTPAGINDTIWYRIPEIYSPTQPPAILVWWHAWGGTHREMVDFTQFDDYANARGWIAAGFMGTHRRHWNTDSSQYLCKQMLDFIYSRYPFSRDSIYMVGSSMGSAGGQVWHNNNCGKDDYIIAATAGGSQILDCELRQLQYLQNQMINESMYWVFGGFPYDSGTVLFNYHRASAVSTIGAPNDTLRLDTTFSMHFNSLHLPVYNTWGANSDERFAYGNIAQLWEPLRAGWAPTYNVESDISDHGLWCMHVEHIIPWLAQFSAKRNPDTLSINADSDTLWYYWTRPVRDSAYVFARYGVNRDVASRSLDVRLIRHVQDLAIDISSVPLRLEDTLRMTVRNYQESVTNPSIRFGPLGLLYPQSIITESGPRSWEETYLAGDLYIQFTVTHDSTYTVSFMPTAVREQRADLPGNLHITAAYPNPFNSEITIEIESAMTSYSFIDLYNVRGQLAKSVPVQISARQSRITFSTSELTTGVYFARLRESEAKPLKLLLLK